MIRFDVLFFIIIPGIDLERTETGKSCYKQTDNFFTKSIDRNGLMEANKQRNIN